MKNRTYALIFIFLYSVSLHAQNNLLENFRQNIPLYTSSLSLILGQAKVDPIVTDIIAKVLPEVANENVDGALLAVSNILYQRKGIKNLDPEYTQFLDTKIRSLIGIIKKNDYFSAISIIGEIAINTNDYVHRNFNKSTVAPNSTSPRQVSNITKVDINKFRNNIFAYPTPRKDWTKEDIDELHNLLKANVKSAVEGQNSQNVSEQQIDDLTDCFCNQLTLRYSKQQFNSIPKANSENIVRNLLSDCMNKVGLNTSNIQNTNTSQQNHQLTPAQNQALQQYERRHNPQQSNNSDPINTNLKGPNGEIVYTGPKGGHYYINQNGNKTYLRSGN